MIFFKLICFSFLFVMFSNMYLRADESENVCNVCQDGEDSLDYEKIEEELKRIREEIDQAERQQETLEMQKQIEHDYFY